MTRPTPHSILQPDTAHCPLLDLPGELRNRIYSYTLEEGRIRRWRRQEPMNARITHVRSQFFGLAQVCRIVRSEFLPLYKTRTHVSVTPQDFYDYVDTFLMSSNARVDELVGLLMMDLSGPSESESHMTACIDIKPLLQLLSRAPGLRVGTFDIIVCHTPVTSAAYEPTMQDILVNLYDIHDMDMFYDYMDRAMSVLELESADASGVEIVFELRPEYWEDWMGEWSKPDHDPDYRIPIELAENVVQWGRQCGMELNRATGSPLTVNFRRGN